jgi:3-hydroxyisobutyrate dehydrogenase-like beta-hydroxyacid dehydrogenase
MVTRRRHLAIKKSSLNQVLIKSAPTKTLKISASKTSFTEQTMNRITLIGLGAMGRALGQALLAKDYEVTLWNRTPGKAEALIANGATLSDTVLAAVKSSQIVMICIIDYAGTRALLDQPGVVELLKGRTIIQLSTGTPVEARELAQWINAQGGSYIDGAIMVYPPTIGSEASQLLIAGDDKLVEKNRQLLDTLGGDIRYLGAEIGAAAALDMAVVSRLLAITPAVIHGALICESEGVSLQQFAEMFPEGDRARSVALTIHNNEFDENISASVDVAIGVASSIKRQAEATQINSEFPDFILGLYHRAVAAGYRHQDTSALVKILRDPIA